MLEIERLSKNYGDVTALDDVTFGVSPGEIVGFLGPNGAGKTTTMRIVMGLAEPDAGDVRFDGLEIDEQVRLRFGYMPEERGLYPSMTAHDELVYFARLHGVDPHEAEQRASSWLERLGLSERADSPVEELSQGNQQRVQLGVALVHEPDLLVLDEPFGGLDPVGVQALRDVLIEVVDRGVGVVFSSHQLDLVEGLCDSVVMLNRGKVVLSGDVDQVKDTGGQRPLIGLTGDTRARMQQIPWVHVIDQRNGKVLVELDAAHEPHDLLTEVGQATELNHFSIERPSLSELFTQAVDR